ncbi:uncharacterized protein LOC119611506 [Lucilia sericata]|uniref:uncharacterized protein LOC119611506 n=1 Tax=Lucilia sericata TaxID=13632 RepID=UPI0018A85DD1|nr:uncharacterized protein LOC119611506 [Lucilia sericata]
MHSTFPFAYAQALEDQKAESNTATTISPFEIEHYESGTDIPKEPESFTATTVSPLINAPASSDKHSEAAQPEVMAPIEGEPTKIEEIKEIFIDENGVEVNYDKIYIIVKTVVKRRGRKMPIMIIRN